MVDKQQIKIGDFIKTGLDEFGTVVDFETIHGLVILEDSDGEQFRAVELWCEVVGGNHE